MGGCSSAPKPKAEPESLYRFEMIPDKFESIEEVQAALRSAGLESSELIVAIDFTKSNEQTGDRSFGGQCLHSLQQGTNPYMTVLSIICKTLAVFDDDRMIPTFGFGDVSARDSAVFSFEPGNTPVHTLENVLDKYRELVPRIRLSGPTSFAPAIHQAIRIVHASGGRYHILVIIADGQLTVSGSFNTFLRLPEGKVSYWGHNLQRGRYHAAQVQAGACMENTKAAIVAASAYPLSIVMVGVGDGPWHDMVKFDDQLPSRAFDNFQFVNFTELAERAARQGMSASKWEANFAVSSLMEIPDQYTTLVKRGALGRVPSEAPPNVTVLEPPVLA